MSDYSYSSTSVEAMTAAAVMSESGTGGIGVPGPVGPQGPAGPQGQFGGSSSVLQYTFEIDGSAPPNDGCVRLEGADQTLSGSLWASYLTYNGHDAHQPLLNMTDGTQIVLQDFGDPTTGYRCYTVTGDAIDHEGYVEFPIQYLNGDPALIGGEQILLALIFTQGSGGITDAPADGTTYGRKDYSWSPIEGGVGPTGPAGIDGKDGADGAPGSIGPTGPQGVPGNPGPAGIDGKDGADGAPGSIGPTGPQGVPGNPGPTGPAGIDGVDGATGPAGATPTLTVGSATASGSTLTITTGTNDVINVACNASCTYTLTVPPGGDGRYLQLRLKQDGTGSRTVTFDSSVAFGTDITSYAATTTANKTDLVGLQYNSGLSKWMLLGIAKGY